MVLKNIPKLVTLVEHATNQITRLLTNVYALRLRLNSDLPERHFVKIIYTIVGDTKTGH